MRLAALFLCLPMVPVCQQPVLTADAIMVKVAANQDSSEVERKHYVYVQHAHVTSRKGKTVRCEETTDYRVTPTEKGSKQQLLKLDGRLLLKGQYVHYTDAKKTGADEKPIADKADGYNIDSDDDNMDRDLVENMRGNLTNSKSKDGIGAGLFPLTNKQQAEYVFMLAGHELKNGRDCYHVTFKPKDKDDFGWKGDAWIDAEAFQPVVVRTTMARKVPFAVRTLMGTSVPGLGFTVIYAPQPDGVWFPVSFGTEFKLHVLFFLNRQIVVDAQNKEFEKTHTSAAIVANSGDAAAEPKP